MVFIQPRFVALMGLCFIASLCSAVPSRENAGLVVRASPTDSLTNAISSAFGMNKDKDSGGKGSKDVDSKHSDSPKDDSTESSKDSTDKNKRDNSIPAELHTGDWHSGKHHHRRPHLHGTHGRRDSTLSKKDDSTPAELWREPSKNSHIHKHTHVHKHVHKHVHANNDGRGRGW
ncbi:hypothetical protein DXG03_004960 [Asterophora parasitica]|uniref:Uncharacterized protein n=1 Tax=Asterophora parasitica TaxID=117018 RepID=A0A9P7KDT5_9AGAR|nr:hypothetical protein DXG03_004960 [Asterophora parasitica]